MKRKNRRYGLDAAAALETPRLTQDPPLIWLQAALLRASGQLLLTPSQPRLSRYHYPPDLGFSLAFSTSGTHVGLGSSCFTEG